MTFSFHYIVITMHKTSLLFNIFREKKRREDDFAGYIKQQWRIILSECVYYNDNSFSIKKYIYNNVLITQLWTMWVYDSRFSAPRTH